MRQQLRIDFHCHCLPAMDDGAADTETAVRMLQALSAQGIETVVLTPHYYAAQESVDAFLARRTQAMAALDGVPGLPHLITGAEVYLDRELPMTELHKLRIGDTDRMLLEMPFMMLSPWMIEMAEDIFYQSGCRLILAHLTRYMPYFSEENFNALLSLPQVMVQINTENLLSHAAKKRIKQWMRLDVPLVYGSDAHNMTTRAPQFEKVAGWLGRTHSGMIPAEKANNLAQQLGLLDT